MSSDKLNIINKFMFVYITITDYGVLESRDLRLLSTSRHGSRRTCLDGGKRGGDVLGREGGRDGGGREGGSDRGDV